MNSNMVKPEKFGYLHLVYHFTVPLSEASESVIVPTFCQNLSMLQFVSNVVKTGFIMQTLSEYFQYECCVSEANSALYFEQFL